MQTFLPYPDYNLSAHCLDDKRLKNQVKECAQILASLRGGAFILVPRGIDYEPVQYSTGGYPAHPATLMWKGYERQLSLYACSCIAEMRRRGSTAMKVYENMFNQCARLFPSNGKPAWLGDDRMHASHRSQLLKKDPEYYGQWGWIEKPGAIDYWWPTKEAA